MGAQIDLFAIAPAPPLAVARIPERMTADRVEHPQQGKCWAVHNNGTSHLLLDDGSKIACAIKWSRSGVGGTWLRCADPDHGTIEMKLIQRGTQHQRVFHREWGYGWIVVKPSDEFGESCFECDNGTTRPFVFRSMEAGTAAAVMRERRRKDSGYTLSEEEAKWITYTLRDGSVHEIRRETTEEQG